jgi:glycosyltransferase involved in cell wall biosynthesis
MAGRGPKVLILSHIYPSSADRFDGLFIHQHVAALKDIGVELKLLSPVPWAPRIIWFKDNWKYYGAFPREETFGGVDVSRPRYVELPSSGFRHLSGWSMFRCLLPYVRPLREDFRFNVIHAHTITPDGHAAILLGRYFKIPVICSVRGSDLNYYPFDSERMYKASVRVLREADTVITVSRALAEKATEMTEIRRSPRTIYNGVDTQLFSPTGRRHENRASLDLPKEKRVLLFVGGFKPEKGVFDLIEAFAEVSRIAPDLVLLMIGDGPEKASMEMLAEKHGVRDRIIFKGNVPHERMPSYMNACDIFVLPTHSEGMPNVVLEAMACRLPVIAGNVGGIPEIITSGHDGLLFPAGNVEALKGCLLKLLADTGPAVLMGERAWKKVKEGFSWAKNASEHLGVYKEILERQS